MSIPPPRMVICFLTPSPFPWNFQVVPPPPQNFQSYLVWVWISSGDAFVNTALTLFAKKWHLWQLGLEISEIKEGSSSSICRTLFKCRGIYLFSPLYGVLVHRRATLSSNFTSRGFTVCRRKWFWSKCFPLLIDQAMASSEDKAYEIMRELDVNYVLVIFGGLTGYASDGRYLN